MQNAELLNRYWNYQHVLFMYNRMRLHMQIVGPPAAQSPVYVHRRMKGVSPGHACQTISKMGEFSMLRYYNDGKYLA
jgi:hypothetical protein